ncbi:hypothetical protein [Paraburkholderia caribensis]|uniref:hypothetical protein n=1 Tax=Paraburkholderia caribensis TaxID=75105 RepID=UPI0012E770A8|nr:hypothetical protein [Paraburkholderia caribensis]
MPMMSRPPASNRAVRHSLIGALALYTLIEAPIEMACAESKPEFIAVLVAKTIWLMVIVGVLVGSRIAERALIVFCLASAIAVLITSLEVKDSSPYILLVLFVDVAIKVCVFISLAVSAVMESQRIPRVSSPS